MTNLTDQLLSHLVPVDGSKLRKSDVKQYEASDEGPLISILDQLALPCEQSISCTYREPPGDWLSCLLQQTPLPWLWDIDLELIRAKEASKVEGKDWDWELWVRQLAQPDISEMGHILQDIPPGFRNRRRIWRLLEDLLSKSSKYVPPKSRHCYSYFDAD